VLAVVEAVEAAIQLRMAVQVELAVAVQAEPERLTEPQEVSTQAAEEAVLAVTVQRAVLVLSSFA
jgi:hypothetical protein